MTGAGSGAARAVDVLIVGGGPAGLEAAKRLAAAGVGAVEVLEREQAAGGTPRYCLHGGFGPRRRPLNGPAYASRAVWDAEAAGATVRTGVTALGWADSTTPALDTVGAHGHERITARAVLLATGARERPRAARLIPGTRPDGILTTGELQQSVHLFGQHVGTRAVVVGGAPVGHAALATLRSAGVAVTALITRSPASAREADARLRHGVPVLTRTAVTEILGHSRVAGVRVRHADGRSAVLPCDTLVLTGDFVPEDELARRGGLSMDPSTRGPRVDGGWHSTRSGVYALGNLVHVTWSARAAAAEGRRAAAAVLRDIRAG
ncbi:FAD-dependent oxidoreductase [Streptomyces sp. SID8379]|uniref:NAD(P)/FAD-dependent oxidoreductase n=1 Tax=unclassified Streptomyces TaxID=2593676 RepID=UPI0003754400|nr:FAD-dependent oxidoreductase [Streptomyces sp. HmicA12]MYW63363.1 FAD-dependent oxidoreductase [Streptomyces sp. SID8379]